MPNIIKFQLQSQSKDFLYGTLCVFSQMKDRKHIQRNFHLVAWVMPQGLDFGMLGSQKPKAWGFAIAVQVFSCRDAYVLKSSSHNMTIGAIDPWLWPVSILGALLA